MSRSKQRTIPQETKDQAADDKGLTEKRETEVPIKYRMPNRTSSWKERNQHSLSGPGANEGPPPLRQEEDEGRGIVGEGCKRKGNPDGCLLQSYKASLAKKMGGQLGEKTSRGEALGECVCACVSCLNMLYGV